MSKHSSFAVHQFIDLATAPFSPKMYSHLKFGCDTAARKMGYELARSFYKQYEDVLLANDCVVIPSPYNYVKNAATVMTGHFIDKLNELLVLASGKHVDMTIIHRKVSYINDYGFLTKEKRKGLIDNDSFYLNDKFIKNKLLLFVDDVKITGTHEDKLKEILAEGNYKNDAIFLYYAQYDGVRADIEGELNFVGIQSIPDFIALTQQPQHHVIIRVIKYILGKNEETLKSLIPMLNSDFITKVYFGCLAEGYHQIPAYQPKFQLIMQHVNKLEKQ